MAKNSSKGGSKSNKASKSAKVIEASPERFAEVETSAAELPVETVEASEQEVSSESVVNSFNSEAFMSNVESTQVSVESSVNFNSSEVVMSENSSVVESSVVAEVATAEAKGEKRGKKAGDISARTLFLLLDKGFEMAAVRAAVEAGDVAALDEMERKASGKGKSLTGKPGRPLNAETIEILAKNGITLEKLNSLSEKERKQKIAAANAIRALNK